MRTMRTKSFVLALGLVSLLAAGSASASLSVFQTFTGNIGYSSDGLGTTTGSGTISASVPVGSTVVAAYLYSAWFFTNPGAPALDAAVTLNGSPVNGFTSIGGLSFLGGYRANVTSIVAPLINGGPGGVYNFAVSEGAQNGNLSGEALVVVYSNPALAVATFGLLDGFTNPAGDTTSINFAAPLNPAAPGFFAEMILGIQHSCCSQSSNVTVNGTLITTNAGNFDDGNALDNSALMTVGGYDDPFSPFLPSYANDHERYNLVPYITAGDTSISINTSNPTADDNIFLAGFYVTGEAFVNQPPQPPTQVSEPATVFLLGVGILGLVLRLRRQG